MSVSERIAAIAEACRKDRYPEPLIAALSHYLAGNLPLARVQQAWQAAQGTGYFNPYAVFTTVAQAAGRHLDDIDRRMLDLDIAIRMLYRPYGLFCFAAYAPHGPIEQVRDYLLSRGLPERDVLAGLAYPAGGYLDRGTPTALGQLVLSYIPQYFNDMLQAILQRGWRIEYFVTLLLSVRPPFIAEAWQTAQQAPGQSQGACARLLLQADPERFTEWVRQVAGPANPDDRSRQEALEALLAHDPGRHLDLAVAAAQTPSSASTYWYAGLHIAGLTAAYQTDPETYWPLLETAAVSPNEGYAAHAVSLLAEAEFERARPVLQECVARGPVSAALAAIKVLLAREWPGRDEYALSLLAHRSKQVRDLVSERLVQYGHAAIRAVAPFLEHRSADARLAAVQVLGRIGGERTRALLAARLDQEKAQKVRQAILDLVGTPETAAPAATAAGSPIEAIVAEAEATLRRAGKPPLAWFDPAAAPGLRWTTGAPVPAPVVSYLLHRQSRLKEPGLDDGLRPALAQIERASAAEFTQALWQGWLGQGAGTKEAWLLPLVGALGDDRLVLPMRRQIDEWSKGARGALAARVVQALGLLDSDVALAEVDDIHTRISHKQVNDAARSALIEAARRRGITREELADQIVPDLGFDERGERVLDYGPRRFTVRLGPDLTPRLRDEGGKTLNTLPKPLKGDDPDRAAAAQAEWKLLRAQLKSAARQQAARLERALVTQRTWSAARWQTLCQRHPLLRPFAITLVWGLLDEAGTGYAVLFRPLADGTLTDAEDEPVELPAAGRIRLVHPIELDEATRAVWQQHLADYEVRPPFPQLSRPVVRVTPEERDQRWWTPYLGYVMNGAALKGRYQKADWRRGSVQDAGAYYTLWKSFPAAGIEAVLETAGLSVGYEQEFTTAIKRLAFIRADSVQRGSYVYDDLADDDERALKLGEVPPVVFSEAAGDVAAFAAAGQFDPDWERKVW